MQINFSNSKELLQTAIEEELYEKLVNQLKKDFSLANIFIDFSENIKTYELQTLILEKIYVLIMEKFSEYLNLLYIIDVPERAFKEIKVTDVVEISEQVTFLILKRELQKVWLKKKYS